MIAKYFNKSLIDLKNFINSNKVLEYENLKKVVDIVEKILNFNQQ